MNLEKEVLEIEQDIVRMRRRIHQHPELSYGEFETARFVATTLKSFGVRVTTGVGGTGVVGVLTGGHPGKVVALRADMDALPIEEGLELPFKSKAKGVMHACGHDAHVAMLLGAARLLAMHKGDLGGAVKFIFQPAEEDGGLGGAKPMIEAGVMKNPKVDFVFGLHIMSDYPAGVLATRPGAIMAAPDTFRIKIIGRGGHGSQPDQTVDPIFVAAQVITALQGVASRMIDPLKPFVISVCSIHSGSRHNVIPDDATLDGTIRTLDEATREEAKNDVREVAISVSKAFGAKCVVSFLEDAYPVTTNDALSTKRAVRILKAVKGTKFREAEPILGGEDFSRYLQEAPGMFYFLGTRNRAKGCVYPNHSSRFKVDEDVLKYGTLSLAQLALEFAGRGR